MTDVRLYGIPDSEDLHLDLASAYETQIEDIAEDRIPQVIEEWSVRPAGSQFRSAANIVDWLVEDASDDAPEGFYDRVSGLVDNPTVLAAAEALRDALITESDPYWIADQRLAEHTITWDEQGEPLDCGKPIYFRRPGVGQFAIDGSEVSA